MNRFMGKRFCKNTTNNAKKAGVGGRKVAGNGYKVRMLKQVVKAKRKSGEVKRLGREQQVESNSNGGEINCLANNRNEGVESYFDSDSQDQVVTRGQKRGLTGPFAFIELDDVGLGRRTRPVVKTTSTGLVNGDVIPVAKDCNIACSTVALQGEPKEGGKKSGCITANGKVADEVNIMTRGRARASQNKAEVKNANQAGDGNGVPATIQSQINNETKSKPVKTCVKYTPIDMDKIRLESQVYVRLTRLSVARTKPPIQIETPPENVMEQEIGDSSEINNVSIPVPGTSAQFYGCPGTKNLTTAAANENHGDESTKEESSGQVGSDEDATSEPIVAGRSTPLKKCLRQKDKFDESLDPVNTPSYRDMSPDEIFADLPPRLNRSSIIREMQDGAVIMSYSKFPQHKKLREECDKIANLVQTSAATNKKKCTELTSTPRSSFRQQSTMEQAGASGSRQSRGETVSPFTPRKFPLRPEEYEAMLEVDKYQYE